jgi:hypothetical protein
MDVYGVSTSVRFPRTVQRLVDIANKMYQEHEAFPEQRITF